MAFGIARCHRPERNLAPVERDQDEHGAAPRERGGDGERTHALHEPRRPDVQRDEPAPNRDRRDHAEQLGGGAASVVRAHSPRIGVVEGVNTYGRTGEHRLEGLLIAAGPGIPAGRIDRPVSVLDFAPTIGALLGVELPAGEGQIVPELTGSC